MTKYIYIVFENGVEFHTSQLFNSAEEAYKYFTTVDQPEHYADQKFFRSEMGSFLKNTRIGRPWHKGRTVKVEFKEVYFQPLMLQDWRKVAKDAPLLRDDEVK